MNTTLTAMLDFFDVLDDAHSPMRRCARWFDAASEAFDRAVRAQATGNSAALAKAIHQHELASRRHAMWSARNQRATLQ